MTHLLLSAIATTIQSIESSEELLEVSEDCEEAGLCYEFLQIETFQLLVLCLAV